MFFKKFKQLIIIFVVTTFIMPQSILAYSNKIIAGGDTIGIKIKTDGVIISGFYKIDSTFFVFPEKNRAGRGFAGF